MITIYYNTPTPIDWMERTKVEGGMDPSVDTVCGLEQTEAYAVTHQYMYWMITLLSKDILKVFRYRGMCFDTLG